MLNKILLLVGKYVSDENLIQEIDFGEEENEKEKVFKPYIEILNVVQKRIATEFFLLRTKDVVDTKSQMINFSELTKPYFKLIKVVQNNKNIRFDMIENGIKVPNGSYEIWYQYLPKNIDNSDGFIETFNGKIDARIYALGIASEYCLLNGMYDTSNYFEEKFINSINAIKHTQCYKNMPKRRWL